MLGHREKMTICKPKREAARETNTDKAFTLDLQPPGL
jgi:hypothetical protein